MSASVLCWASSVSGPLQAGLLSWAVGLPAPPSPFKLDLGLGGQQLVHDGIVIVAMISSPPS